MNEEKLGIAINQGYQAAAELERTNDAFALLKSEYMKAWEGTAARDTDSRERLWQAIQILEKVKSHLHSVVANGKIAAADVKRLGKSGSFLDKLRS